VDSLRPSPFRGSVDISDADCSALLNHLECLTLTVFIGEKRERSAFDVAFVIEGDRADHAIVLDFGELRRYFFGSVELAFFMASTITITAS